VFSEKIGSDGEVIKKKARLVAKGYMEIWGEDYWNTYSPMLGCCRWENGPICELPTETKLTARACHYLCPEICNEFDT